MHPGTLPLSWKGATALESLSLGNNQLTGTLPASWGDDSEFETLRTLSLENNRLSGTLPPAWGRSKAFYEAFGVHLRLDNNTLSGMVPSSWLKPGSFIFNHFSTEALDQGPLCGFRLGSHLRIWLIASALCASRVLLPTSYRVYFILDFCEGT